MYVSKITNNYFLKYEYINYKIYYYKYLTIHV